MEARQKTKYMAKISQLFNRYVFLNRPDETTEAVTVDIAHLRDS